MRDSEPKDGVVHESGIVGKADPSRLILESGRLEKAEIEGLYGRQDNETQIQNECRSQKGYDQPTAHDRPPCMVPKIFLSPMSMGGDFPPLMTVSYLPAQYFLVASAMDLAKSSGDICPRNILLCWGPSVVVKKSG